METMMSLINTEVKPFKAQAYLNGQFIEVTEADLKGKWSVVFFYPADFTFVCPTDHLPNRSCSVTGTNSPLW